MSEMGRKAAAGIAGLAVAGGMLAVGCSTAAPAHAHQAAAHKATPAPSYTEPPATQKPYPVPRAATALVAKLRAHGVRCGAVAENGLYTDCGNHTTIQVGSAPKFWVHDMIGLAGPDVLVGPTWAISTTPKLAAAMQQVLGGSVVTRATEAAQTRAKAARKAARRERQRAAARAANTVTYVVNGSPADVTYGPAGNDIRGTVPMNVSAPIGSSPAAYYAVDAQLNGGGTVTDEILVGSKVISSATASGSYNIASAEIDQNPLTGQWEDTNGG